MPAPQSTFSPAGGGNVRAAALLADLPPPPATASAATASPEPNLAAAAEEAGSEHRRAQRTNMFIAATAEVDGRPVSARIRNMSETGALVELSEPVLKGVRIALKRGNQAAAGWVAWSAGYKCGIAFSGPVCVATWMGRPVARDAEGQRRVDAIQAQMRGGAVHPVAAEPARAEVSADLLRQRLSEELVHLKQVVDSVGEALAGEPAVLDNHAASMQQFDIVSQTLGHLARVLTAPDPVAALGDIGMDSLRRRLAHGEG